MNWGAFRKESHAHRGRCAASRTARDIAQTPFGLHEGISEGFLETFGKNIEKTSKILLTGD